MTTVVIGSNTGNTGALSDVELSQLAPTSFLGNNAGTYLDSKVASEASRVCYIPTGLPSIPGGVNITSATLTINNADPAGSTRSIQVRELLNPVIEAQANWNQRVTGTNWNVAGALTGTDVASTVIATGTMPTGAGVTFTATGAGLNALCKAWIEGTKSINGIIVNVLDDTTTFDTVDRRVRTKESADGQRPTLTIVYDTITLPTISVTDTTVSNVSGTASFVVSLSSTYASNVTVDYATANDTATSGVDYTATSGTLTFTPGQISKTVTVPILP